jgi:hypothetical protein
VPVKATTSRRRDAPADHRASGHRGRAAGGFALCVLVRLGRASRHRLQLRLARGIACGALGDMAKATPSRRRRRRAEGSDRLACLKRETYLCEEMEKASAP